VTLAAEVADVYTSARQYQNLIALLEQEVVSRRTSEKLVELKIREGLAPSADSLSVAASTAEAADRLESQRGLFAQTCNQLVMLTGLSHGQVQATLGKLASVPQTKTLIELEVPAKAVVQRPDVRSAESLLVAASADIGGAIAGALPSLSLAGSIGINSTRASGTSATLRTWSFGPALDIPIFRAGVNAAKIEAARARYDQALADYRSSVVTAVQEIEDALVRIDTVSRRLGYARRAAGNYAAYFTATERSYREGRSSLLELEEARRRSHSAQESFLSVELEQAQAWIALYKALGGGWPAPAVAVTAAVSPADNFSIL
jgi:NodT family efflux transporter outer membrane factor (OMF) lipoprotein